MIKILKFIIFNLSTKKILIFYEKVFMLLGSFFLHSGLFSHGVFFCAQLYKLEWIKKKLISSFHQTDLTEIQVINKNIKRLNRRTIYRTFKAINENKGIQRRPGSGRISTIN